MRDPRYDILFEPMDIGPVTSKNRFYQVPHCNGMGHRFPHSLARMRGIKAEGGWGVVCTEEVEIHPSSDITPYNQGRLWDDTDIGNLRLMTDAVHEHGSLAGIELVYQGLAGKNHYSRLPTLAPTHASVLGGYPMQARAMNKRDIKELRTWYRDAAIRSKKAGFDIVYTYAGHGLSVLMHFLSRQHNDRTDEYGGDLPARTKFAVEIIQAIRQRVGADFPIIFRFSQWKQQDYSARLAETPEALKAFLMPLVAAGVDIFHCSTRRFWEKEFSGSDLNLAGWTKELTGKPVITVGSVGLDSSFIDEDGASLDMSGKASVEAGSIKQLSERVGNNEFELVAVGRALLQDPQWVIKVRENRLDELQDFSKASLAKLV